MKRRDLAVKWLIFAEDDLKIIGSAVKDGIYTLACFHSQQCAEKSLKGFLVFSKGGVDKTHSLVELLNAAVQIDNKLEDFRESCLILDRYYTPTRYPDALPGTPPEGLPGRNKAEQSYEYAKKIFSYIKKLLV